MLENGLMPETTRSTLSTNPSNGSATQSDGAPSDVYAIVPSERMVYTTRKGRSNVLTCPEADQFLSGANTVTLPRGCMACARARSPGACTPSSLVTKICMIGFPIFDL